jgi:hypothetical protein
LIVSSSANGVHSKLLLMAKQDGSVDGLSVGEADGSADGTAVGEADGSGMMRAIL